MPLPQQQRACGEINLSVSNACRRICISVARLEILRVTTVGPLCEVVGRITSHLPGFSYLDKRVSCLFS
jgi:hypothetical protein